MISFDTALNWLITTLIALVGTVAFAVIFHVPKKQIAFVGLTGAVAWLTYSICITFGLGMALSSLISSVLLTYCARILSFARSEPVITFLICGIFPIVPGYGIYYTGYYFFMGDNLMGAEKAVETIRIAIAIAVGIGVVLSLPRFLFTFKKRVGEDKNA